MVMEYAKTFRLFLWNLALFFHSLFWQSGVKVFVENVNDIKSPITMPVGNTQGYG
jgi:hypothetical protein